MTDFTIREATSKDLPAIRTLWLKVDDFHRGLTLKLPRPEAPAKQWSDSFEGALGKTTFLWVAEMGGSIEGFLLARLKRLPAYLGEANVGEIADLYVDKEARGQKVAVSLAETAIEALRGHNVHSIEIQIMAGNHGGLAFWHKQGFHTELTQVRLVVGK
ncbi:MAG: GNAT family N-acetyltransferase [Anaerolineae bacterium]|nr:MAG: GNAT family N-acetyltransferase [Anaerolineae bacterium]